MTSIADSSVIIQTSAESVPSTPAWFGEVGLLIPYLRKQGVLAAINSQVRLARRRFGHYEVIDFLAVLFGACQLIAHAPRHLEQPVIGHQEQPPATGQMIARLLLDEELLALLEPLRAPLVLCYLQEKTNEDAARELGIALPHPHLSANMLTFLPVMIALRGWSLRNDLPPDEVIEQISAFIVRGLGFE